MAIIEKKCWLDSFEKIMNGEMKAEFRIADFSLHAGDSLVLREFDPKAKKFSGRTIEKKCVRVSKFNPLDYYKAEDLKRHGCYLIEME